MVERAEANATAGHCRQHEAGQKRHVRLLDANVLDRVLDLGWAVGVEIENGR
jgi:hypothetical protein